MNDRIIKTFFLTAIAFACFVAPGLAPAEITEFREGMPYAERGFGVRRNFYASGRLGCQASDIANVYKVYYVGAQPFSRQCLYSAAENCTWGRCLVPQVEIDGVPYRLEFNRTVHYPFGYRSECTLAGVKFAHELVLDRNVLFRRVKVLENPEGRRVVAKASLMNSSFRSGPLTLSKDRTRLAAKYDFKAEGGVKSVTVEVGATGAIAFPLNDRKEKPLAFGREKQRTGEALQALRFDLAYRSPADEFVFYLAFDRRDGEEISSARIDRVYASFAEKRRGDAVFIADDPVFANAFNFLMPWAEALDVDGRGAIRASTTYWVWGWDAMVHAGTLAMTGRADEVKKMLRFFRAVADPVEGILHAFPTDFVAEIDPKKGLENANPGGAQTLPRHVQLFYVILLNDYYQITGDEELKAELLPFAKMLVERAKAACEPGEKLPRGFGFFPDNPYAVDQRRDDVSLINNSIYCQGLRAYEELTGEGGEDAAAAEKVLVEKLWDSTEGFWADAWDVHAAKRRPHYPAYGYFYVSPFGLEVMPTEVGRLADYMQRHFRLGLYHPMFAYGTASWCADGNQLGAYYPVTDRTYWNVMNAAGRVEALAEFRRTVSSHWSVLTYPEGQTTDVVNADPADYSDELGNKQFFAGKSWLSDALELNFGLRVRKDGLHFHALGDGHPFAVENLVFRGSKLSISLTGSGVRAKYRLNGKPLPEPFIPWSSLTAADNRLEITLYPLR